MGESAPELEEVAGGSTQPPVTPSWWVTKIPVAAVLVISVVFVLSGRELDTGTLTEPGPGFWPLVLAIALAVTALYGLVINTADGIERFDRDSWRVLVGSVVLYLFIILFSYAGVILPGILLVTFWLRFLAGERWRTAVAIGVVGSVLCYLLFVVALGVALPPDLVASVWGGR